MVNQRSKRRRLRVALTLSVATCLTATLATGVAVADEPTRPAAQAGRDATADSQRGRLRQAVQQAVDAGVPGVILRVDNDRDPVVELARQAPWTMQDHRLAVGDEFRMASNTKTMAAVLALQLVAEGRLELGDPVEKWLPGQIPNGKVITLRMLLNHTSGLADYYQDPDVLKTAFGVDQRPWTPSELLARGVKYKPSFAPGQGWSYSNTGYVAVGLVLEKATGHSLADLVEKRIARPLHLRHTYVAIGASWRGRHAHGYEPDAAHLPPGTLEPGMPWVTGPGHDGYIDATGIGFSGSGTADGAVVSTAQDWATFSTALLSGKLLPPAQLKQMRTLTSTGQEGMKEYGLGLAPFSTPCGTVWGHGGNDPGYASTVYTDATGRRSTQILITSTFAPGLDPKTAAATQALETAAVCTMLGKPIPSTPDPTPDGP